MLPDPSSLTGSFVGRLGETAQLGKLLGESRLVTVTGSPGIGKTRLVREVAAGLEPTYAHKVWVADLAAIRGPGLAAQTVARALGVGEVAGEDATETLVSYLADRRLLLVLDNCEHLLEPCAGLADRILRSAPEVSLLLTSQQHLGLAEERVLTLGPLEVSGPAVELFMERARAVDPNLSLAGGSAAAAVAEICRLTDGIPLAIELVSARVTTLSLDDMVSRLHEGIGVMETEHRSPLSRHRSMQMALEWSHSLLSDGERALLRRLSVFLGGWSVDAAIQVCSGDPVGAGAEVSEHLESLVAKSLVVLDTSGDGVRYRLLETVHLFASEHLAAAGETQELEVCHLRWFAGVAGDADIGLTGPDQLSWLQRLDADYENMRAALSRAVAEGHVEEAVRLAGGLSLYWRLRGHLQEGRRWLSAAVELAQEVQPALLHKTLWGAGLLSLMVGDGPEARALLDRALELARQAADVRYEGRCLLLLGNERVHDDSPAAMVLLEQAVALARKNDDHWCSGLALGLIGRIHETSGDTAMARQALEECISGAREANELQGLRLGLLVLGDLCSSSRDFGPARGHLVEALAVARQLGETYAEAAAHCSLGDLELRRDPDLSQGHQRAETHFDEALDLAQRAGAPDLVVLALSGRGRCARLRGDLGRARRCFNQAINAGSRIGMSAAGALVELGRIDMAAGNLAEAAQLFERAAERAREDGDNRTLAGALSGLGRIARARGDVQEARNLHTDALRLAFHIDDRLSVAIGLEAMAGLARDEGRLEPAVRLFAAADGVRKAHALGPSRPAASERNDLLAAIGAERFEALWAEGGRLSAEEAVSYARRRRGRNDRPAEGWSSLTNVERDVVALVSEGLTNAEVAARMFISPRTVGNHLSRIYARLGLASRTQLVNVARDAFKGLNTE